MTSVPSFTAEQLRADEPGMEIGMMDEERRGEEFAQALYGILALHGPADLDTRERLELGHFICLATTDWVRARNRAKATAASSVGTEPKAECTQ